MVQLENFRALGLSDSTVAALEQKGFEEPTQIQKLIIPILLAENTDIIGQAQTGTGKTAAFGLPLIEKLDSNSNTLQALILVPSRELAIQVSEEINSFKGSRNIRVAPIYGGQSYTLQLRMIRRGLHIIVGTPGRLMDHINRKSFNFDNIKYVILDEADEMLNMGFIDDVEKILSYMPKEKQMALFSATMPPQIISIAKKYMHAFKQITTNTEKATVSLTDQIYFEVRERDKFEALCRIIDIEESFYGLVFCRTKSDVDMLSKKMIERGYDAEGLHGDLSQNQRERILYRFRQKMITILVATDVAARGIDIIDLTHVINFSLPQDPDSYIHRIGRTGRAGKEGTAITFVTPEEYRRLGYIKRVSQSTIRKEKVPNIKDVIGTKKERIKKKIVAIIENESHHDFKAMASELLTDNKAEDIIAALFKYKFEELSESKYDKIEETPLSNEGKTRLFIAKGKLDKMTKKILVDFITERAHVDGRRIDDVRVFDKFSFITVPFTDAERILTTFKSEQRGHKPIVERADASRSDTSKSNTSKKDFGSSHSRRGNYTTHRDTKPFKRNY